MKNSQKKNNFFNKFKFLNRFQKSPLKTDPNQITHSTKQQETKKSTLENNET
jgi:hypothetical protein